MLVKVGEEGSVSQVLETRGIVRHDVVRTWEVICDRTVTVVALESTLEVAQARARAQAHGGTFVHAANGWSVIHSIS